MKTTIKHIALVLAVVLGSTVGAYQVVQAYEYFDADTGWLVNDKPFYTTGNLRVGGMISSIGGFWPANGAIRLTPNLHLNSMGGNEVMVNWDNGTTDPNFYTFSIGNGAGTARVFIMRAGGSSEQNGTATIYGGIADGSGMRMQSNGGWFINRGNTGWYNETYNGGFFMSDSTWIRTHSDDGIWTANGLLGSNGGLTIGYGGGGPNTTGGAIIAGRLGVGTNAPSDLLHVAGTARITGGIVDGAGWRMDAGGAWFRTYGQTGWYNDTYAGGFYMTDTTWVRAYNGKGIWTSNVVSADAGLSVGYGAGINPNTTGGGIFAGRVGIGTAAPAAQLDIRANGADPCCAPGTVTPNISLSQLTNSTGQMSWIQFHNNGESEAYIRLSGGGGGARAGYRRIEIGDNQGVGTGLRTSGIIETTAGGVRFPDGTTQTTAFVAGTLTLANNTWLRSTPDNTARFYFAGNGRTYFGSQNGHEFRNAADGYIAAIENNGNFNAVGEVQGAALSANASSEVGGSVRIKNPTKTGTNVSEWHIFNMTGAGYGNALKFWRYAGNSTNLGPTLTLWDGGNVETASTLVVGGQISTINGITPPNGAIRLTPNLHLNATQGHALIVNWDNGLNGGNYSFRVGNGAGADVLTVNGNGQVDSRSSGGAGGYISSGNFGGTGSAAYFPSGIWANGANNWIYGTTSAFNAPWYDMNDNSYLIDPNQISYLNDIRVNVMYDRQDTSYYVDPNGTTSLNDLRPNIIYDRNNTGFYVNPDGTTRLNELNTASRILMNYGSPTLYFQDNDGMTAMIHNNANLLYILRGGVNQTGWEPAANNMWPLYFELANNNAIFGGNVSAFAYYYNSDIKLKKDITPIKGALEKINQLEGHYFTWKDSGKRDVGVIAQEVQKVFPEIVNVSKTRNPETNEVIDSFLTVEYGNLIAPVIEAIKELTKWMTDLRKSDAAQDKDIEAIKQQLNELAKENKALKQQVTELQKSAR